MKTQILLLIALTMLGAAQEFPPAEDQLAAALWAAPEKFREGATVYGWDADSNMVILRKGSNEMICLADNPFQSGYNSAAYHIDLEPFMARGRGLRAEGKTTEEIRSIRGEEAKDGTLRMPKDGATLHILFGPEGRYDPDSGTVVNARYRYVVYIPWATTATTGLPEEPNTPGGPWIMDAGTHRAHIMIIPPEVPKEEPKKEEEKAGKE